MENEENATLDKDMDSEENATLGKDMESEENVTLGKDVESKENAILGKDMESEENLTLGKDVESKENATLGKDMESEENATLGKDMESEESSDSDSDVVAGGSSSSENVDAEENLNINEDQIKEELAKMYSFQEQIKSNELNYEAHLGLILTLRKLRKTEELRKAREHMNKFYPLSPDIWMAWITDEQKCKTPETRVNITNLFEKSVSEYTSVKIWVEYIMFMLGEGDEVKTRLICERALTAVGIHVAEGLLVWQAVALIESQIYFALHSANKEIEKAEQKLRVKNLFKRQARVPLMNLDKEEFLSEASFWFDNEVHPSVKSDLEKSFKRMKEKLPFEEAISMAADEIEKLEAYRKYIDFVRKSDNPAVVQNLYERTITDLCLHAALWEEYIQFLMDQFSFSEYIVLPVCERSQWNCPWSGALCELHATALQKFENSLGEAVVEEKVKASIEKTVSCGAGVSGEIVKAWMAYLVYLRRKINWDDTPNDRLTSFRKVCEETITTIENKFNEEVDLECTIARFQARIEAEHGYNMETARVLWNDHVMKRNNNFKNAVMWLEYLNLERSYGTDKHCRKLFRRALERVWESIEVIGSAFLRFEQECGTLETMLDFEKRYRDRLSVVQKRRMEEAAKEESARRKERGKIKQEKHQSMATSTSPKQTEFKKPYQLSENRRQTNKQETPSPRLKRPAEEVDDKNPKKPKVESTSVHGEFVPHDHSLDHRTVFLSNMDYKTEENEVLPVFADCGEVENFRITRDFKGRSKGFGYLVFVDSASVIKALKLDRTLVGGRPLFISRCNPKDREHVFKFSSGLEKEKLFVKGLPFSMSEEDIRKLFESHGEIKSTRLVTHRNGYSKGICYIEYHDSETAAKVMKAMDGHVINDLTLSVKLSNPSAPKLSPIKPLKQSNIATNERNFGVTRRPKVAFVPRVILKKPQLKPETESSPTSSQSKQENGTASSTSKSNEDFRKMLLK